MNFRQSGRIIHQFQVKFFNLINKKNFFLVIFYAIHIQTGKLTNFKNYSIQLNLIGKNGNTGYRMIAFTPFIADDEENKILPNSFMANTVIFFLNFKKK